MGLGPIGEINGLLMGRAGKIHSRLGPSAIKAKGHYKS